MLNVIINDFPIWQAFHNWFNIFLCKNCGTKFVVNLGFEKMKASPKIITSAMQLYFSGESLRNTQKFLKLQGVKVSHVAILKWIRKYIVLMDKYLEQISPTLSNTWRADELFMKIKGERKYLYAMMDDETRFWIAQQVSDNKFTENIHPLFERAEEFAGKKPDVLISDGAQNFHEAYLHKFYTRKYPRTVHVSHIHQKGDTNNNKMERLNNEIRDREKTMRSLKKTDSPILKGYQIYHNYIREHEGLKGQTPAEVGGIQVEGENKWLTLIQNACSKEGKSKSE